MRAVGPDDVTHGIQQTILHRRSLSYRLPAADGGDRRLCRAAPPGTPGCCGSPTSTRPGRAGQRHRRDLGLPLGLTGGLLDLVEIVQAPAGRHFALLDLAGRLVPGRLHAAQAGVYQCQQAGDAELRFADLHS